MESIKCKSLSGSDKLSAMSQLADSLGGEEAMKVNYPKAYQAYQHSKECSRNSLRANMAGDNAAPICDIDILHVAYTDDAKDKICVKLCSEFENELGLNIQNVSIVDSKTNKVLGGNENRNYIGAGVQNELIVSLDGRNVDDLDIRVNAHKISNGVDSYSWEGSLSGFKLIGECMISVSAPRLIHTNKANKDINVSLYISEWGFSKDIRDYWYPDSWTDKKFRLEGNGVISAPDVHLTGILGCYLSVTTEAHRTFYHNDAVSHLRLVDPHKIIWEFPKDWGFSFDLMKLRNFGYIAYNLSIQASCSDGKRITFLVSSEGAHPTSRYLALPKINLCTDCFAKGTVITMENGSKKLVERLQEGDRVLCEGSIGTVRFAESSKTKMALGHLILENGAELTATQGHMIATDAGLKCLSLLSEGDIVKMQNGSTCVHKAEILPIEDCEIVVVGVSTHRLYANCILVGDSEAILTDEEKAANIRLQVPEEWRKDYDSWIAGK